MSGNYVRTRKGLRNSFVAVSLQFISILVGFFSRKIFLDYLGTEILGLNTTAQSLLGFLNLAELGIGAAVSVTLYKPLFEDDRKSICEIVALQGWLYRRIAAIVIFASIALMFFFPRIFAKTDLPLGYAYLSFGVMLFSSLLSYFVNYKQIVLSANQKDYKIQLTWKVVIIIKLIVQAVAVKLFEGNPFFWWVGLELAFTVLSAFVLNIAIFRDAPYLKNKVDDAGAQRFRYPQVVTKVKQLFVHKVGGVLITQSSPVILYAFTSLSTVAIYGNYLLISNNLSYLLASLFTGLSAGIGNVIAENNSKLVNKLFREIYSARFVMVSICSICLWFLTQPFVSIWLGDKFLLDNLTLALIIVNFWLLNMRNVTDTFITAYGLFSDILSPLIEALINVGCSVLLGSLYGLNGILIGIGISQLCIHFVWKPYFLFKKGLKTSLTVFVGVFLKHLAVFGAVVVAIAELTKVIPVNPAANLTVFLAYGSVMLAVAFVMMEGCLLLIDKGARSFAVRIIKMRKEK